MDQHNDFISDDNSVRLMPLPVMNGFMTAFPLMFWCQVDGCFIALVVINFLKVTTVTKQSFFILKQNQQNTLEASDRSVWKRFNSQNYC